MSLPVIMGKTGAQPAQPSDLRAALVARVAGSNPGYTANLPASLIEDVASTEVGGLAIIDTAQIDTINSLTPYGANEFLLNDLGNVYGVPYGQLTNTSVYVVFTGTPGFTLAKGFTVSDGQHQYVLADGGIIPYGGTTEPLFAIAATEGAWAVPALSVNQLVTSVPTGIVLSVTNPLAGTPSVASETTAVYRSRVLQAGLAASQGMPSYLKTLLKNVPGVQPRLVSARQASGGGWEVIVGGTADPYEVADAVFRSLFDVSTLVGSVTRIVNVTNGFPGVVTTDIDHGLTTGQKVLLQDVLGMTSINNVQLIITVIGNKSFGIGIDTTAYPAYAGGGTVTPNYRNQVISIYDYPDTYSVPFVVPPQQQVRIVLTWNTTAENVISTAAVAAAASQAEATYVNSVGVGQPMNLFEMQSVFQASVADVIPIELLTRMEFIVSINGIQVNPDPGTGIIEGDPESYFQTDPTQITVVRG